MYNVRKYFSLQRHDFLVLARSIERRGEETKKGSTIYELYEAHAPLKLKFRGLIHGVQGGHR